ncbi:hypothetical protein WISP_73425 [Willisornis vidua]|uniref:Uncharacterized protein n=1 Tax=Willisornis vidua TaxID=1566151 RepID=A0ABQ9DCB1_9PASS|nr:hypothetical protein WISP_73425 [Willisornis vidua]
MTCSPIIIIIIIIYSTDTVYCIYFYVSAVRLKQGAKMQELDYPKLQELEKKSGGSSHKRYERHKSVQPKEKDVLAEVLSCQVSLLTKISDTPPLKFSDMTLLQ